MEKLLKALIVMAILVLPWQYFYSPQIKELQKKSQDIVNMLTANQNLEKKVGDQSMRDIYLTLLDNQKKAISKEKKRVELLMPSFSTARTSLLSPFELLRSQVPGDWTVVPEGKYKESGSLVFWPFNITFLGTTENTLKALAHIESGNRLMRVRNMNMKTEGINIRLSATVELVYQNDTKGETR